jgi:hypothetical protein
LRHLRPADAVIADLVYGRKHLAPQRQQKIRADDGLRISNAATTASSGVSVLSTASPRSTLFAAKVISCCPSQSKARSYVEAVEKLANVG